MISAVILSHNDESIIERAIKSVSWCGECIIIDDDSTDNTQEIAKKYGAIIIKRSLQNDFAAQRNAGLAKAKGPWVLFLDSDEVVSPSLKKEVQRAVSMEQMSQSQVQGYYLKRMDHMWGKSLQYGETADVRLVRLGKKDSGSWERAVHEVWQISGRLETLSSPILHYPHPTVTQFTKQINRYSTVNADMLYKEKTSVYGWHIIAYPVAKFIKNYIWLMGFRDGIPGFCVAVMMSFHSFLTRGKLFMKYNSRSVPLP